MDGNKRTAFLAALYFLANQGYRIPKYLPKEDVIRFCVSLAQEKMHQAQDKPIKLKSIAEIADWFRYLLKQA